MWPEKYLRGHFLTAARLLFARVVSVARGLVRRRHRLVRRRRHRLVGRRRHRLVRRRRHRLVRRRRRRFAYPVARIAPAKVNFEDKTARRGPTRRLRPRQLGRQPEALQKCPRPARRRPRHLRRAACARALRAPPSARGARLLAVGLRRALGAARHRVRLRLAPPAPQLSPPVPAQAALRLLLLRLPRRLCRPRRACAALKDLKPAARARLGSGARARAAEAATAMRPQPGPRQVSAPRSSSSKGRMTEPLRGTMTEPLSPVPSFEVCEGYPS